MIQHNSIQSKPIQIVIQHNHINQVSLEKKTKHLKFIYKLH